MLVRPFACVTPPLLSGAGWPTGKRSLTGKHSGKLSTENQVGAPVEGASDRNDDLRVSRTRCTCRLVFKIVMLWVTEHISGTPELRGKKVPKDFGPVSHDV